MRKGVMLAMAMAMAMGLGLSGCGGRSEPAPDPAPTLSETPVGATSDAAALATGPSDAPPAAAPSPAATPIVPAKLNALGTEPFWGAAIDGSRLTYTTPDDQAGQSAAVTREERRNGARFSGRLGSAALSLEVTRRSCSDGMSDRVYPFAVVLKLGEDRREGCAS